MTSYTVIGKPVARIEGPGKVTGTALYTADLVLPNILWAKALRSHLAHARILRIDTSRAQRIPGVRAIVTGADVSDSRVGRRLRDMPILPKDKVRFIGEKVALVAAEDPDIAEEAALLIDVEYEPLPAVFDPLEALEPSAPILHENINSYQGLPQPVQEPTNLFARAVWSRGDVDAGFAQADYVFEHTFTLPMAHQAYLEPHVCIVAVDGSGRVQIWANNKGPYNLRQQMSLGWGIPQEQIHIVAPYIGGDFGGKGDFMDVPAVYYLAKATGRPVKMVMTYMEEFLAGDPRHPGVIFIKSGVNRDGTLVARQARAVFNSGAYGAFKGGPALHGASSLAGSYRIPHLFIGTESVYTNTVPRGHARAPGAPQAVFAEESHMDIVAKELGLDPLEFRLKNAPRDGDPNIHGTALVAVKAEETLRAAAQAIRWSTPKPGTYVGRGLSLYDRAAGAGESRATVSVDVNGLVTVLTTAPDQGGGTHTIMRQVAAEVLSVPLESVRVVQGDTDTYPSDGGVGGSRATHTFGQAAYLAAQEVRERAQDIAADLLESPKERLRLQDGRFVGENGSARSLTLAQVAARAEAAGTPLHAQKIYDPRHTDNVTAYSVIGAEVEVDPETGQVRVRRMATVVDSGTVINATTYRGQVWGGLVQGLGYALMEEMPVEEGRILTVHFGDYKVPTIRDIPELETVVLESPTGPGPYGSKAVGEVSNVPVAAAIANAVADACGVRITDLPITAEKVLRALRTRQRGSG
jgi:CO/xanthine dehydrogenase Mo-binding subunit